ncbi:MAG: hypothetical protein KUG77_08100, partial [Nannocystaceae bacterium]|nr:hypothetical protein [Nannocystaceae bacterium]
MLALGALLLGLAVPPAPPPRPAALKVTWVAPGECPDERALRERVLEIAALDAGGEGTLFVEGAIEAFDGGFELRLRTTLGDLEDQRSIRDSDCDALVQAAALFLAVSVDPFFDTPRTDAPPSEPEPTPRAEPRAPLA